MEAETTSATEIVTSRSQAPLQQVAQNSTTPVVTITEEEKNARQSRPQDTGRDLKPPQTELNSGGGGDGGGGGGGNAGGTSHFLPDQVESQATNSSGPQFVSHPPEQAQVAPGSLSHSGLGENATAQAQQPSSDQRNGDTAVATAMSGNSDRQEINIHNSQPYPSTRESPIFSSHTPIQETHTAVEDATHVGSAVDVSKATLTWSPGRKERASEFPVSESHCQGAGAAAASSVPQPSPPLSQACYQYSDNQLWLTGSAPVQEQAAQPLQQAAGGQLPYSHRSECPALDVHPPDCEASTDDNAVPENWDQDEPRNSSNDEDGESGDRDGENVDGSGNDDNSDDEDMEGPSMPAAVGGDIDMSVARRCLHCHCEERNVRLPCGHRNLCYVCFFCKSFWCQHLRHGQPRCLLCRATYQDIYDRLVPLLAIAYARRRPRQTPCGCSSRRG